MFFLISRCVATETPFIWRDHHIFHNNFHTTHVYWYFNISKSLCFDWYFADFSSSEKGLKLERQTWVCLKNIKRCGDDWRLVKSMHQLRKPGCSECENKADANRRAWSGKPPLEYRNLKKSKCMELPTQSQNRFWLCTFL